MPNDNLLVERSTNNPQDKEEEHPFLLPISTSVLDDYFFVHREILVWKYLATGCHQDKGQVACPQNQQVKFGVDQSASAFFAAGQPGVHRERKDSGARRGAGAQSFCAEERCRGLVAVA